MPFLPEDSLPRVQKALDEELRRLRREPRRAERLEQVRLPLPPDDHRPTRIAVVAADAGNLELRLHPMRVGLVRVATSEPGGFRAESFVPLSRSAADQVRWVFAEPSMQPLRAAAAASGADPDGPGDWLPQELPEGYALHFLRELLEWLLLVHVAATAQSGTLLLRDGLLRSVAIPKPVFAPLCRTLKKLTTDRGLWLCALAKRAPGGSDFLHYLDVAVGAAPGHGESPAAYEVPPALEQQFSPSTYASMRGRRAGLLYLWIASSSRRGRPLAIEIPVWQQQHAGWLLACLGAQGRGGFPEPGYPPELLAAHQAARIAPIEREALGRAFLRQLAKERRPELRERLLLSHLTGQGIVLDPQSAEGDDP
ncbi:MAG: hypothetical protein FJ265_03255 [Planctomycetes bacterium]|nr:hypothetical protein [Planctomycetota bacterium]